MQTQAVRGLASADPSPTSATKTVLSLADAIPTILPKQEKAKIAPPPGLEHLVPPPGLEHLVPTKDENSLDAGSESDTSAGSVTGYHSYDTDSSAQSDGEPEQTPSSGGLVLAEISALKANAPMFTPMLSAAGAALLMPEMAQRTPLRAPLRSKAKAYVPQFSAAADTGDWDGSWQTWNTESSSFSEQAGYCDELYSEDWYADESYVDLGYDGTSSW